MSDQAAAQPRRSSRARAPIERFRPSSNAKGRKRARPAEEEEARKPPPPPASAASGAAAANEQPKPKRARLEHAAHDEPSRQFPLVFPAPCDELVGFLGTTKVLLDNGTRMFGRHVADSQAARIRALQPNTPVALVFTTRQMFVQLYTQEEGEGELLDVPRGALPKQKACMHEDFTLATTTANSLRPLAEVVLGNLVAVRALASPSAASDLAVEIELDMFLLPKAVKYTGDGFVNSKTKAGRSLHTLLTAFCSFTEPDADLCRKCGLALDPNNNDNDNDDDDQQLMDGNVWWYAPPRQSSEAPLLCSTCGFRVHAHCRYAYADTGCTACSAGFGPRCAVVPGSARARWADADQAAPSSTGRKRRAASLAKLLDAIRPSPQHRKHQTPEGMVTPLLEFQKQGVAWMVERETQPEKWEEVDPKPLHPLWRHARLPAAHCRVTNKPLCDSVSVFASEQGRCSENHVAVPCPEPGGVLADEMGLGKTLEVLALVLAHPASSQKRDPSRSGKLIAKLKTDFHAHPHKCKATLIICPPTLLDQWEAETRKHAPSLTTMRYCGCSLGKQDTECAVCAELNGAKCAQVQSKFKETDVVFTTYNSLRTDLGHARLSPRNACQRAPLLSVQWWRIVLDEAQMVCDSNSQAAVMASELWRVNGWCVTGTPIQNNISDLHGLLVFLDHDPFADRATLHSSLLQPFLSGNDFSRMANFLQGIMWRHAKDHVADQLNIPPLIEETISVHLTPTERLFYDTLSREVQGQLHHYTNNRGYQLTLSSFVMSALQRLRQACCHPNVMREHALTGRSQRMLLPRPVTEIVRGLYDEKVEFVRTLSLRLNSLRPGKEATRVTNLLAKAQSEVRYFQTCLERIEQQRNKSRAGAAAAAAAAVAAPAALAAPALAAPAQPDGEGNEGDNDKGEEDEEQNQCTICLELFESPLMTPCAHQFCSACVLGVFGLNASSIPCPICRQPVSREALMPVAKEDEGMEEGDGDGDGSGKGLDDDEFRDTFGSKITRLVEEVKAMRERDPAAKCIVFSQWNVVLSLIQRALFESSIETTCFFGSMRDRDGLSSFVNTPSPTVLLASLRASATSGAAGLNLTVASTIFLVDPTMNFGMEEQAIGRAYRIGQTRRVRVVRLLVADSVEERIVELVRAKKQLASARNAAVFSSHEKDTQQMRAVEVRRLFGME